MICTASGRGNPSLLRGALKILHTAPLISESMSLLSCVLQTGTTAISVYSLMDELIVWLTGRSVGQSID